MDTVRIAHISDLHFSKISLSPLQFFSKRWLGNLNLLLRRGKIHKNYLPFSLLEKVKEKSFTDLLITGDFTTTSFSKEFDIAKRFVSDAREIFPQVHMVPGNHDHYTKSSFKRRDFYKAFPEKNTSSLGHFTLKEHGVSAHQLSERWWIVLLDTTEASALPYSTGIFSEETESNLQKLLREIPSDDAVMLANHFPFFQNESPRRMMKRGDALEKLLLKHPNIKLYTHGHTHRRCIADLRKNNLPIIVDSGSLSDARRSSWNLIELSANSIKITVYCLEDGSWKENRVFEETL